MSGLHPKSIEIISGTAAHVAAELYAAGKTVDQIEDFKLLHMAVFDHLSSYAEEQKDASTWSGYENPAPLDDGTAAVVAAFPGSTPVAHPQGAPTVRPNPTGRTQIKVFSRITVPGQKDERGGPLQVPNPSWLEAKAIADGVKELWDNRSDSTAFRGKTENGFRPWFKEKLPRDATDEEKGAAKAYFPPRDSIESAADYVHPSFVNVAPAAEEEMF